MGFSALSQRQMVPELMDAPELDASEHAEALQGLRRLNKASRAASVIAGPIVALLKHEKNHPLTLLDVACGGGDVPVEVARQVHLNGADVELTLMDRSATALQQAERTAKSESISVRMVQGEAPHGLPNGTFDVVTNSLFLHHLERAEVVNTLQQMARHARRMVVVSDLRRSAIGWVVAWIACRFLSRSVMVRHDGPVSVRAAWTMEEMRGMAAEAGMKGAVIKPCWPWRMLMVWQKPGAGGGPNE